MPLSTPRVKLLGWALFEVLASADQTQLDLNVSLLDGYVDIIFMHLAFLPERHGAVSDGTTDDVTACQAAIDECNTAGSGDVPFRPARTYKISTALSVKAGVTLKGQSTTLKTTSTTFAWLVYGQNYTVLKPTKLSGFIFTAANATTQANVSITARQKLKISECAFNGDTNSNGPCISSLHTDALQELVVEDCRLEMRSVATTTAIALEHAGGALTVRGGRGILATGLNSDFIKITGGQANFIDFVWDGSLHGDTSGGSGTDTGTCLRVTSASALVKLTDCRMIGAQGLSNGIIWTAAATIIEHGTTWEGFGNANFYSGGVLARGSYLDTQLSYRITNSDGAPTLPNGYQVYEILSTAASAPTIELPDPLFIGQRIRVILRNAQANTYGVNSIVFDAFPFPGDKDPNFDQLALAQNKTMMFDFICEDVQTSGTPVWLWAA